MCQIFSNQNPRNYSYISRSVRLEGQVTSIRLEGLYWAVLNDLAAAEGGKCPCIYREALS